MTDEKQAARHPSFRLSFITHQSAFTVKKRRAVRAENLARFGKSAKLSSVRRGSPKKRAGRSVSPNSSDNPKSESFTRVARLKPPYSLRPA